MIKQSTPWSLVPRRLVVSLTLDFHGPGKASPDSQVARKAAEHDQS